MKFIISFCLSLIALGGIAQQQQSSTMRFYLTYEDYLAGKEVYGKIWTGEYAGSKIEIQENGTKSKHKIKDLHFFGVTDELGYIMRFFDDGLYYVMSAGNVSVYIPRATCHFELEKDGRETLRYEKETIIYLSQGTNGDLEPFTDDKLRKMLGTEKSEYKEYKKEADKIDKDAFTDKLYHLIAFIEAHNKK